MNSKYLLISVINRDISVSVHLAFDKAQERMCSEMMDYGHLTQADFIYQEADFPEYGYGFNYGYVNGSADCNWKIIKIEESNADENVEINVYDKEEIHYNCTVIIWENSTTGNVSVGWSKKE